MGMVLTYLGGTAVAVVLLSQIAQHSEILGGWAAERLWSAIEGALGGRKLPGPRLGAIPRWAVGRAMEWGKTGALIVADPFIDIARSFVPEFETVPVPPTASAGIVPEPATLPAPADTRPTEEEYRQAVAKFGLSQNCPQSAAAKKWATLRSSGDDARTQEIDAAWSVICKYRGFRIN